MPPRFAPICRWLWRTLREGVQPEIQPRLCVLSAQWRTLRAPGPPRVPLAALDPAHGVPLGAVQGSWGKASDARAASGTRPGAPAHAGASGAAGGVHGQLPGAASPRSGGVGLGPRVDSLRAPSLRAPLRKLRIRSMGALVGSLICDFPAKRAPAVDGTRLTIS